MTEVRAAWEIALDDNAAIWIPKRDESDLEPIGAVVRIWLN